MTVTNLKEHKKKKNTKALAKKIAVDLDAVLQLCDASIRGLTLFNKYTQVMEIISCLQTNKTLIEMHLAKYEKILEKENG